MKKSVRAEDRPTPKPPSRARINRGPDPTEEEKTEFARLKQKRMQEAEAKGLSTEPLKPGERPHLQHRSDGAPGDDGKHG